MRIPYFGRLGFLYEKNTARSRPARVCTPFWRDCPDLGRQAYVFECLECEKYKIWHESEEAPMCYYEFKDLESRGHYDGTWDQKKSNFDPETFARIQEEKRVNEEVNRELEMEWEKLERKAEELAKKPPVRGKYETDNWEGQEEETDEEDDTEDEEEYLDPFEDDEEDYF